jgi:hypothetical protein
MNVSVTERFVPVATVAVVETMNVALAAPLAKLTVPPAGLKSTPATPSEPDAAH